MTKAKLPPIRPFELLPAFLRKVESTVVLSEALPYEAGFLQFPEEGPGAEPGFLPGARAVALVGDGGMEVTLSGFVEVDVPELSRGDTGMGFQDSQGLGLLDGQHTHFP